MKLATIAQRAGIIIVLTLASIAFHEFGHFIVYWFGGCPVRITLQSVQPIGSVSAPLNHVALAPGPAFSLIGAVLCLLVARRHPSFSWVTAAFINATLRLFPLTIDILQAIGKTMAFSDEGNVMIAITASPSGRALPLVGIFAVFLALAVVVARHYSFKRYLAAKAIGIYLLSLAVGIAVVLIDELHR